MQETTIITSAKGYVVKGTYSINASFKRDNESTTSKQVTLRVNFDNVPLQDVITKALAPTRITWQNNVGRKKFDTFKNGQVVNIDFTSPGKKVKTDEEKIEELAAQFMAAGLDKKQANELATKAVKNPEIVQ